MNVTIPEIETYFNTSQETYKVDEYTKSCIIIIGPLVQLLQEFIYNTMPKSGGFVMDGLRAHYDFHNSTVIKEGLYQVLYHMMLGYGFIVASLITLILLPVTCCMKFCSKSNINLYKYQICFCMEGFAFILACVALFLGAVSSLQTAVHVDEAMQSHPELGRNIIDDLISYRNNIQIQLVHLKHDLDKLLEFDLNCISDLPYKATSIADQSFSTEISIAETTFTQVYDTFLSVCKETGIDFASGDNLENKLKCVNALPNVGKELNYIRLHLEDLRQKVLSNSTINANERELVATYIFSIQNASLPYFYPENITNSELLYSEISEVINDLPKANASVHFLKNITNQISDLLQPMIENFTDHSLKLKSWSNSSLVDFTLLSEKVLPNASLEGIKRELHHTDKILTFLDVTSKSNLAVFSGRAFLVLVPGLHSLMVLSILSIASICGVREINQLNHTGSQSILPKKHPSFGAKLLYFGNLFGLSLLWLNFFIAGTVYITSIVTSMLCQPVIDSTIFINYIDDTQVWNGSTWIDTQMREFVNDYHAHIKMMDVLQHCANNKTVYNALGIDQFWNISEKLNIDQVKLNETELQLDVIRAMNNVEFPDIQLIENISNKLIYIGQKLDIIFDPKFIAEIEKLQHLNVAKSYILSLVKRLRYDTKYNYVTGSLVQILNNMSRIENHEVSESIAKLAPLKAGIGQLKEKLSAISLDLVNVNSTLNTRVVPQINNHVNFTITLANNLSRSFMRHAEVKLTSEVGNCKVLYNLYRKSKWAVCSNGLTLVNAVWTSHAMMAVSMTVLLLLSCRIASYLRGAHRAQIHWQQRLLLRRRERKLIKSKALMFGAEGEYHGKAVLLRGRRKHQSHVLAEVSEESMPRD